MKIIKVLSLLMAIGLVASETAFASTFTSGDKVYIIGLPPKSPVEIPIERISFRKITANKCGALEINTTTIPALFVVDDAEFRPANFPLQERRTCTKNSPNDSSNYKASDKKYFIAGLVKEKSYLVKIIKPTIKKLKTTKCGYASFKLVETLTPFSSSFEFNIYSVNGIKVKNMASGGKPSC